MNLKTIKKKIELALRKAEAMKALNNYFIFWKGKEDEKESIPDKSLVIILTEYEPEEETRVGNVS